MVKNFPVLCLLVLFLLPKEIMAQEIKIFTIQDFDLKGKVKSCLISTNYGKEEYNFNAAGVLVKSVTRYNDVDYDITYYKYLDGMLLEKRLENYRDNTFDKTTSIANFFTIDSTLDLKITEKIVSYNKEFLDQHEYFYKTDTLRKIVRTNSRGTDETQITYTTLKNEKTKTYFLNEVMQQSVRTSEKKVEDSIIERNVLTKNFLEGTPDSAIEEVFDGRNNLVSKTKFLFNEKKQQLAIVELVRFIYDSKGMLLKTQTSKSNKTVDKEYIYQFDINGNWIKEIITPENAYTTRKISYYSAVEEVKSE